MRRRRRHRRNPSALGWGVGIAAIGVIGLSVFSRLANGSWNPLVMFGGPGPFGAGTLAEGLKPGDIVVVNADASTRAGNCQIPLGIAPPCVRVTEIISLIGGTFRAALLNSASSPIAPGDVGVICTFNASDVIARKCGS